ncbi:MAG: hypothetical protein CVU57_23290 [Deltaproteobacteria bacterium HGW-Deltaproteobacteria-15]|jgi:PAS domain S-box-containing protein|nr:MAG: hypothetical protein CVU57_23290 [Deltaproteobacteria bacterium HGW-Deltaproteobacteria-15]
MLGKKSPPEDLRSRAERILNEDASLASSPLRGDLEELFHELDVYRIELEIQNEELRASQEKLQESRSRYYELYNLAPVAFLTVSPIYPHRILGANSMACRALGMTRTRLVGMPFSQFAAAEEISALHDFINKLKRSDEELTTEIRMHRKSPPLEFFARIQAVRVEKKKQEARILLAMSDVSELVRARRVLQRDRDVLGKLVQERTAELETANRDLGQKNQELEDFAFIASHDLREPIRKVLTFGSILEERYKDRLDKAGHDYLDRMRRAASRMELMLTSLLEYSRLDTSARSIEKVSLNEVLNQVRSNLAEEIAHRKARLKIGDLPVIEAEPQQIVQLFQNLIANALKYSEKPPEINVYAENGRGRCTIYVVDNGIGFEPKYLDKIFSPFERLHGRETYEGTGMGLTICRKIAERHKGGITATSTPGEGSVFIVTLPYKQ